MATQTKVMIENHDFATGEIIQLEATPEELASFEIINNDEIARRNAEVAKAEAKAGLFARLGITAEEAELLLG
jgi:hypothetical protein